MAIPLQTIPVPHGAKSKKFNEVDFKRWQEKMLLYLTTLNLARFLIENSPTIQEENDWESIIATDAGSIRTSYAKTTS